MDGILNMLKLEDDRFNALSCLVIGNSGLQQGSKSIEGEPWSRSLPNRGQ